MSDQRYEAKVFISQQLDDTVSPLTRALHYKLCKGVRHPLTDNITICEKAARVVRQWLADGSPSGE